MKTHVFEIDHLISFRALALYYQWILYCNLNSMGYFYGYNSYASDQVATRQIYMPSQNIYRAMWIFL